MNFKLLLNVFFLCFLGSTGLFAQSEIVQPIPKLTLKYSPISLIDAFTPSIQFAVEQRIAKRQSLQYEAGYLTSFGGRYVNQRPLEGYRIRLEWRRYKERDVLKAENNPHKNWIKFMGFQVMWKQHRVDRLEMFCRDDCNFFQNIDYTTQTSTIAAYWNFGWVYRTGRFRMEFGTSAGLRYIDIKDKDIPENAIAVNTEFIPGLFYRAPGRDISFPFFSAVIAFKVGYILKN